ncbi:MAG: LamG-like jellyroll fold domain-containing protein [Planctomycetota bacterium]
MRILRLLAPLSAFATAAAAQLTPDVIQYQFNEIRGTSVSNTASSMVVPATGTLRVSSWQSDTGRPAYRGNEPGFGCIGYRGASGAGWVHTGWQIVQTGSFTVMFWMRRDPASTSTNPFGYAFGDVTFRAFAAGGAGTGITFRGTSIGNVDSGFSVTSTPGVWQHVTLVVDDAAGQALWFDNGAPSSIVVNFPPNSFSYSGTRFMAVAAQGDSGLSPFGQHYDMDDFRYFGRALTQTEILAAMLTEEASAGTFGTACAGPNGLPVVAGFGLPQLGNATFRVDLTNAEPSRPCALVLGVTPATFGTFDLSGILGSGCLLQTDPFAILFNGTGATGATQALPIPSGANLHGAHLYAQWVVAGSTGAVTEVLDINLQ